MTWLQWLQSNALPVLGGLFALYIIAFNKLPSIATWQAFLDSFESKGGQLMLLWVTDFIVLAVLVHYWKGFDAQLQTTIVGLLSGVNGAFLGAIGARATGIGGGPGAGPGPIVDAPLVPSPPAAPAVIPGAMPTAIGFAPSTTQPARHIGHVGDRGDKGDLGTNNSRQGSL